VSFVGRHGPRTSFDWKGFQVNRRERWAQLRVRCLKGSAPDERHLIVIEDAAVELELAKRKEDWRRMVAHDLRSPITSVLAALLLLKEKPAGEGLDAKEANLLDVSVRSCRRLTELLDLFLDVAKLDEGVMPVSKKAVALLPLVREAVAEQSALAASKRVSVDVAMDAELAVLADEELLSRAVRNLLNNGIKFTHKDGRITIRAERAEAGAITLSVEDTGSGIAPADLPSLFDRFYQASARREGRIQGNGLGLTFCREALKAMGGEIGVRSEVGKGSEFVVRLPAAVPDGRR
jgi:signal transduction histidine kinase